MQDHMNLHIYQKFHSHSVTRVSVHIVPAQYLAEKGHMHGPLYMGQKAMQMAWEPQHSICRIEPVGSVIAGNAGV